MWSTNALGPEAKCQRTLPKVLTFILCCLVVSLVSYGHLFNGDTSVDQEILGLALGVWVVITCRVILQQRILNHIKRLHEGRTNQPDLNLARTTIIIAVLGVIAISLGWVAFFF